MSLHDFITNELIEQKSLSALIWLIDQGREFDFSVNNVECFISRSSSSKNVSLWVNHVEQSYDNMEELIKRSTINGKPFLQVWKDISINTLF